MTDAFKLELEMGNAAFEGEQRYAEVARILRDTANKIQHGAQTSGEVFDINGNCVGSWSLDPADEEDETNG